MKIFISGGSASGKSLLGENICSTGNYKKNLYIATMEPFGEDAVKRIERHKKMREGKNFETIEKYHSLCELNFDKRYNFILLECLSNLLANEIFTLSKTPENAIKNIVSAIKIISEKSDNLVVISNEIFSDILNYNEDALNYIKALGTLNLIISKEFDVVVESVYGIVIVHKGKEIFEEVFSHVEGDIYSVFHV